MKYGQPFVVDAKALTMARASRVLALQPSVLGSMLALPESVRETETLSARASSTHAAGAGEVADGSLVAVASIDGALAQRGEQHLCGVIDGYDWVTGRVTKALADPKIGALVLRINSPGGDYAGLEEAVKRMRAAADREGKRIVAFVDEQAASAAYWIASGVGDEIMLPPSGEVGSIGVVGAWVDASEAYKAEGFEVHIVRDPPGKAAMHPAAPVADIADERLAALVREARERFFAAVAARREGADPGSLNGGMLSGKAAVKGGLADKVGSLEDAIDSAARAAAKRRKNMKGAKALAVLGLTEEATDEQIEAAGERIKLASYALELTGATDAPTARGKLAAWKESAEQVPALQKRASEAEAAKAKGELASFLLSQVGKKLTPAMAWAKDDDGKGMPIAGEPAQRWVKMGLAEATAFVEELHELGLVDDEHEPIVRGAGLTEQQLKLCQAQGMDPQAFAQRRANIRIVK